MSEIPVQRGEHSPERLVLRDDLDTIELRQIVIEDASAYFALVDASRGHLSQFGDTTAAKYQTVEDVERSVTQPEGEQYRFGIWDNGEMVGFVKLKRNEDGDLESGSWIGKQYTGNNYAQRARRLALGFAFNTLQAPKVVSKIAVGNEASRKSVEASGYQYIGEHDGLWIYVLVHPGGLPLGNSSLDVR